MNDLHTIQMQILRELIFHPKSKFSQLNISDITNDHFSYHIKVLIEKDLVKKDGNKYSLTTKGKMFSSKMDTANMTTEKQPKVSVLIRPILVNGKKKYFAIQQRLKEPYYGYFGFMCGKVKWGEKILEAGARELDEEMGLHGDMKLDFELHEMVYDKEGNMLEDKYFHCISVEIKEDTLRLNDEGCQNAWMTKREFMKVSPKYHNEVEIFNWFEKRDSNNLERTYFIEGF